MYLENGNACACSCCQVFVDGTEPKLWEACPRAWVTTLWPSSSSCTQASVPRRSWDRTSPNPIRFSATDAHFVSLVPSIFWNEYGHRKLGWMRNTSSCLTLSTCPLLLAGSLSIVVADPKQPKMVIVAAGPQHHGCSSRAHGSGHGDRVPPAWAQRSLSSEWLKMSLKMRGRSLVSRHRCARPGGMSRRITCHRAT